jgi:hypothetical protein
MSSSYPPSTRVLPFSIDWAEVEWWDRQIVIAGQKMVLHPPMLAALYELWVSLGRPTGGLLAGASAARELIAASGRIEKLWRRAEQAEGKRRDLLLKKAARRARAVIRYYERLSAKLGKAVPQAVDLRELDELGWRDADDPRAHWAEDVAQLLSTDLRGREGHPTLEQRLRDEGRVSWMGRLVTLTEPEVRVRATSIRAAKRCARAVSKQLWRSRSRDNSR